ncbi:4755_t:CDS:2, partial [Funneliformis geosporum]
AESADESSDEGSVLWCTEELENNVKETLQLLMNAKEKKVVAKHKKKITDFFSFTSTEEGDSIFENENSPTISESSQASEDEFNPQTDDQESVDDENFNKEYLLSDNELIKEIKNKISDNKLPAGLKWKLTAVL